MTRSLCAVIDLHSHVLPGVDDGPADLEGSLALARAAAAAGTRVLAATPHIGLHYDVAPSGLAAQVGALALELERAGVPLELVGGGELAPTRVMDLSEADLRATGLGGGRCVLLECPFTPAGELMIRLVAHLQRLGFRVLLAHPERSPTFLGDLMRLETLVQRGAFVQLTAASLTGRFGRTVRRFALELLDRGLVHVIASDAHDVAGRPPEVLSLVAATVTERRLDPALTAWVCEAVPRALLDDASVPPGPDPRPRRRRLLRRP